MTPRKGAIFSLSLILLLGCLSRPVFAEDTNINTAADPYEKFNRVMFNFNEVVDKVILKPLGNIFNALLPKPISKGLGNFFNNIDTIPTVINDVLQGNFYQATNDSWRLLVNSTIGIFGLVDIGSEIGLEPNSEDFGLTLARWGYENSNYLVLPFLGPSTPRDGLGFFINYEYFTIYPYIKPTKTRYEIYFLGIVTRRAELLRFQNVLNEATLDKYVFMRDAYMQRRAYLIQRNKELSDPYLNPEKETSQSVDTEATTTQTVNVNKKPVVTTQPKPV